MVLVAFAVTAAATVTAGLSGTPSGAAAKPAATHSVVPTARATPSRPPLDIGLAYGDTLPFLSDQDLASALDDAVKLGTKWIRVDLSWEDIQPDSPTEYQWGRFDRVAQAAKKRGLQILAVITYTPRWARPSDCLNNQACAPADPDAFAAFARLAATRYAPMGVHTWEIWNEPNITFWLPKPDPAAYTRLLRATTKTMRQADPRATLLMGGLAAVDTSAKKHYVSTETYLTAVAKLGGNRLVDGVAYHPYTYPYLPTATTSFGTAWEKISTSSGNLVSILAKYGTPNLPIWITETGAPTNGPGAAAANKHVAAVFWFTDRDTGTDKATRSKFFGLRRIDGTAKPSFGALTTAISAYERSLVSH